MANGVTEADLIDQMAQWLTENVSDLLGGNTAEELALSLLEGMRAAPQYADVLDADIRSEIAAVFAAGNKAEITPFVQSALDLIPTVPGEEVGPALRYGTVGKAQAKAYFVDTLRRSPGWDERRYSGEPPPYVTQYAVTSGLVTAEEAEAAWGEYYASGRDRGDPLYIAYIGELFAEAWSAWQKQGGQTKAYEGYEPLVEFENYVIGPWQATEQPEWSPAAFDAKVTREEAEATALRVATDAAATTKANKEKAALALQAAKDEQAATDAAAATKELSDRTRIRQAMRDAGLISGPSGDLTTDLEALRGAQNTEDAIYADIQIGNDFFARGLGPKVDFDARVDTRVLEAHAATLADSFGDVPYISAPFFLAQSKAQLAALREIAITGTLTPEQATRWDYLAGAVSQITNTGVELSPDQEDAVAVRANEIMVDSPQVSAEGGSTLYVEVSPGRHVDFAGARAMAMEELGLTTATDTETILREQSPALQRYVSGYDAAGTAHRDFPGGRDLTGAGAGGDAGRGFHTPRGGLVSTGASAVVEEEAKATFRSESEILTDIATSIGLTEFTDDDLPFLQHLREKTPDLGEDYQTAYDKFIRERQFAYHSKQSKYDKYQTDEAKRIEDWEAMPAETKKGYWETYPERVPGDQGPTAPQDLIPVSFSQFTRSRREERRTAFEEEQRREETGAARDVRAAFGLRSR